MVVVIIAWNIIDLRQYFKDEPRDTIASDHFDDNEALTDVKDAVASPAIPSPGINPVVLRCGSPPPFPLPFVSSFFLCLFSVMYLFFVVVVGVVVAAVVTAVVFGRSCSLVSLSWRIEPQLNDAS